MHKISNFGLEFVKKGFVEEVYGRALSHAKDRREEKLRIMTSERILVKKKPKLLLKMQRIF